LQSPAIIDANADLLLICSLFTSAGRSQRASGGRRQKRDGERFRRIGNSLLKTPAKLRAARTPFEETTALNQTYRWNQAEHAAGYDSAAEIIHPHYLEIQDAILARIARPRDAEFLLVDLGGGSGRLAERFLGRFPRATAIVVDQSEAFLEIAARRMAPFEGRGSCQMARLQDDWAARLPTAPQAITSMSAIHHLSPEEKQAVYAQAYGALEPLGILLNGDEIRPDNDAEYRTAVETWAAHMRQIVADERVDVAMRPLFEKWADLNVTRFGQQRVSGDDWHETIETQLAYFCDCGFRGVSAPWHKQMWAVLEGIK
jgi:tRNA (cmo5U34)-methyltransferase